MLEVEVAEMIQEMFPQIDRVRFLKTGNEATLAALRIVRADGKSRGVYSEGYHGWGDPWTSLTPPAVGVVDDFAIAPLEDPWAPGAKIIEPLMLDASESRKQFVGKAVNSGGPIIFDEIITALRVPKFSVGRWWDLTPSVTVLGKALASGFPLSVVGGQKDIMDSDYFVSSTFSGDAIALAACKATLKEIQTRGMEDLWYYADRFQTNFNKVCQPINVQLTGYGTRSMLNVDDEPNAYLLIQEMGKAGVLLGKAFFYSFAHMDAEIDQLVLNLLTDVVQSIKTGKVELVGEKPTQTFKR
jgi:glutamate-1-semialdehyde aminotransferase